MIKFGEENVMIDGVESLREVKKYTKSVIFSIKIGNNVIVCLSKGHFTWQIRTETKLIFVQQIKFGNKIIKSFMNKPLENFGKKW